MILIISWCSKVSKMCSFSAINKDISEPSPFLYIQFPYMCYTAYQLLFWGMLWLSSYFSSALLTSAIQREAINRYSDDLINTKKAGMGIAQFVCCERALHITLLDDVSYLTKQHLIRNWATPWEIRSIKSFVNELISYNSPRRPFVAAASDK